MLQEILGKENSQDVLDSEQNSEDEDVPQEMPNEENQDTNDAADKTQVPIEELEEIMRELGHSDAEIAHVLHGHHFPDIDEVAQEKAETERASREGELSLKQLEMEIKQMEAALKDGHGKKLNNLEANHKEEILKLEREHAKRMKDLEYSKAQKAAEAEDDTEHKKRLREVEYTKAQKDIPGDRFDNTEHQKRMMDLEYEKAKREMELDLEIKKQQSELKMKQMLIDAEVRKKEKEQSVKENAQVKKEESVKKKSNLAKSNDELPSSKLAGEVGKTHTVEVHPDLDMYYRAKGAIKESNKPHLQISDFKRHGFPEDIVKKLPRNAKGKVTPEMIDSHIASLPKHKVNITVGNYTWGSQQHRDGEQHALSVNYHPDTLNEMPEHVKNHWNIIKDTQHKPAQNTANTDNQIGWSRIDSNSKKDHWHIDELQSDFQSEKKIAQHPQIQAENFDIGPLTDWHEDMLREEIRNDFNHPFNEANNIYRNDGTRQVDGTWEYGSPEKNKKVHEYVDYLHNEASKRAAARIKARENIKNNTSNKDLHRHLSHGHDDPQHLIHSATNALARKLGINSISMDTPKDQATQSGLRGGGEIDSEGIETMMSEDPQIHEDLWRLEEEKLNSGKHGFFQNPHFKTALDKIGGIKALKELADNTAGQGASVHSLESWEADGSKLSGPERDAVHEMLTYHFNNVFEEWERELGGVQGEDEDDFDISSLPVHQQDTYHKRPKRLGMKEVPKKDLLGEHPQDKAEMVQHMILHKKLQDLKDLLKQSRISVSEKKCNK